MRKYAVEGDTFLDWKLWMQITHADLMKFHMKTKQRDNRKDEWDRENHNGKQRREVPKDIHKYRKSHSDNNINSWLQVENEEKSEVEHEEEQQDDSSHHTTDVDDEPETKLRGKNSCLQGIHPDVNPYNKFKENGHSDYWN